MHILALNHEFPPLGGGGANASFYIAREAVRLGHRVTVITSHVRDLPRSENVEGVEVIRLNCLRRNVSYSTLSECFAWITRALPFAVRWARANRPDVVQSFFALPSGPIAMAAARAASCPLFVRLGGGDVPGNDPTRYARAHRFLMPVTRWIMRSADGLIVNSSGLREKAEAAYPGLSFTVIPNGVDVEEFCPCDESSRSGPLRLLCVSRLIERKGLQYLIPALARLRGAGHDFRLRIVGDGPMLPELENLIADGGLGGCVTIDGPVAHDDLPDIYREADVFVLPSLAEGMPNVVLEALSSGLAIVGTNVAGMDELVQQGRNGWLVSAGDTEGLEATLATALSSTGTTRDMGTWSRTMACHMDWSRIGRAYSDTWQSVLAQGYRITEAEPTTFR